MQPVPSTLFETKGIVIGVWVWAGVWKGHTQVRLITDALKVT